MSENPYAPPASNVDHLQPADGAPALWNPNAAASWSLLFTPAFGAYLQMLNWRALGDPNQERQARNWFYASLAVLVLSVVIALALPEDRASDSLTRLIGFVFLFTWYFAAGKRQIAFVKERYGDGYPRRPWAKPLLIAVAAAIGFIFIAGIVGVLIGW